MFEALKYIIYNNIDLLLISVTKLDDSFPIAQFQMKTFSVSCSMTYIREDIQYKLLLSKSKCNIETLSVAANLRKKEMVSELLI